MPGDQGKQNRGFSEKHENPDPTISFFIQLYKLLSISRFALKIGSDL
jgi:hypothetical protein